MKQLVGRILFTLMKAAGKCLVAFLIQKIIKRSNEIMLTVNENGKKVSFWGAIGQIALASIASYGMTKMGDEENTSWVPYRNQMMANMAAASFSFLGQQMQQQQTQQTQQAADQQQAAETQQA